MLRMNALTGFGGGGGVRPIEISIFDLGNVNSTPGATATFSSVAVGSGGGRTLIVLASIEDENSTTAEVDSCTVDGNACTRRVETGLGATGSTNHVAIFTKALTTENGNVDIVLGGDATPDSWGMSFYVVTGMQSEVPTDSAVGSATDTTVATGTTLDGLAGGIAVGIANHENDAFHSWASSMTERSDTVTGGDSNDHKHGTARDLLPTGRSASTETVNFAGSSGRFVLATATFR